MKEFIKKTLGEINTGDVRLSNPDYDFIEVEMFDKELFVKKQLSQGIRCFGFGSYRYGCNYCMSKPPYTYKYNFLDDEDAGTLCADYFFFLKKEQEFFNEMLETTGEPVYYIDDSKLNVDLKYGDILLHKNLKYENIIEFLELQAGSYGRTIESCITQEVQFYEWLTSKEDKKAHVNFYGKKIIVSPDYSQTQNSGDAIMTTTVSAHEGSLYKVNIDMRELAKRVGELNNDLYKRLRSVYEKYHEIKKSATYASCLTNKNKQNER